MLSLTNETGLTQRTNDTVVIAGRLAGGARDAQQQLKAACLTSTCWQLQHNAMRPISNCMSMAETSGLPQKLR